MLKQLKQRRLAKSQGGYVPQIFRSRAASNRAARVSENQRGFTIIEVMIVLAIAALILVIVFLAVPALQRSSRNTQRKTDASNELAALSDYVSNNNGQLPTPASGGACAGGGADKACSFIGDAKLGYYQSSNVKFETSPTNSDVTGFTSTPDAEHLFLIGDAQCSNATTPTTGTSARQYVAYYGIEGSTKTQCVEG